MFYYRNRDFRTSVFANRKGLPNMEKEREEIIFMINTIQSEKFLLFIKNLIISFKKEWGY